MTILTILQVGGEMVGAAGAWAGLVWAGSLLIGILAYLRPWN